MTDKSKIEGEGSYSGTKQYDKATEKFIKDGKVDKAAQDAKKAVESDEAKELTKAEDVGKAGDPRHQNKQ